MKARLPVQPVVLVAATCSVGLVLAIVTQHPFGLLAPTTAIYKSAARRDRIYFTVALGLGLTACFVALALGGLGLASLQQWAAFCALALCLGGIVNTSVSAPQVEP